MADTLRFDRELYDEAAVQAGVAAFGRFARLELSSDEHAFLVQVHDVEERHAGVLGDELANYVLAETVVARGAGASGSGGEGGS